MLQFIQKTVVRNRNHITITVNKKTYISSKITNKKLKII